MENVRSLFNEKVTKRLSKYDSIGEDLSPSNVEIEGSAGFSALRDQSKVRGYVWSPIQAVNFS